MKITKPLYVSAIVALILASCKTINTIPVPRGESNVVSITAKKVPLTKEQQHSWGHADLATDTIPGMSIAKAYAFLKGKKGQTSLRLNFELYGIYFFLFLSKELVFFQNYF